MANSEALMDTQKKTSWVKPACFGGAVLVLLVLSTQYDVTGGLKQFLEWVDGAGPIGPIALGVIYIVAAVLFIPGSLLTLGAGAVFGVVIGSITVSIASTLGATVAFLVGRYMARDAIAKRIGGNPKFDAIDKAVAREGWKIVGLTRLSPVFPFNLLNYAFGLTSVSLRDYVLASWIGMMPGTVMYVYIGSVFGLVSEGRSRTTGEYLLYGIGLAVTVVVTVFITRVARRALNQAIDEPRAEGAEG